MTDSRLGPDAPWDVRYIAGGHCVVENTTEGRSVGMFTVAEAQLVAEALNVGYPVARGTVPPRKLSLKEIAHVTYTIFNAKPDALLFDNVPSDMTWGELVQLVSDLLGARGTVPGEPTILERDDPARIAAHDAYRTRDPEGWKAGVLDDALRAFLKARGEASESRSVGASEAERQRVVRLLMEQMGRDVMRGIAPADTGNFFRVVIEIVLAQLCGAALDGVRAGEPRTLDNCPTCGAPAQYTPAGSNYVVGDWHEEWEYEPPVPLTVERLTEVVMEAARELYEASADPVAARHYAEFLASRLIPQPETPEGPNVTTD